MYDTLRKLYDLFLAAFGGNPATPLLATGNGSQITASTSDGSGNLLTYTELLPNGTTRNWTLTYHADGSIATQTHA